MRLPRPSPPRLVVMAASTGGPAALGRVLPHLPGDLPVPVLVVQHLPAGLEEGLAARFDRSCALGVGVAANGELLHPGRVWLAPGYGHLEVMDEAGSLRARIVRTSPVRGCRPAADVLFRSAAWACGARTLAVVLTGMGRDGLDGARAIHARRGHVFIQDRATSAIWGMPGAVARAGLASEVLPLDRIAPAIAHHCSGASRRAA